MAPPQLPKMMLGFVVRRCAAEVGHHPTAEEFAAWANSYQAGERTVNLFGRSISTHEAKLILKHPERPVSARAASPRDPIVAEAWAVRGKVTAVAEAAARLRPRRAKA